MRGLVVKVRTTMNLFRRPDYQSTATQFLRELKARDAGVEQRQMQGRLQLWEKPLDRSLWASYRAGRVAQKPYVYQTSPQD